MFKCHPSLTLEHCNALTGRFRVDENNKVLYNNLKLVLILCRTPAISSGGREYRMSEVRVKDNESLDSALRRWKKSCARSGVLAEVRKREHYEKPSVRRKKKSEAARKRKFK